MRRIIVLLLAFVLVLPPVQVLAQEEQTFTTEDKISYKIDGDHIRITRYAGTAIAGKGTELVIPAEIDGYPVRVIDDLAFSGCIELKTVTVPETVTTIKCRAFRNCTYLEAVYLPDTLTELGHNAFNGCTKLRQVTIPTGLTTLEVSLFSGCKSLTEITIPDSVTRIKSSAFSDTALTAVIIPATVLELDGYAFSCCTDLEAIRVDENNPNYSSDSRGVLFNKEQTALIRAPGGIIGSYTVLDTVTSIQEAAFSDCTRLTEVVVPENVRYFDRYAFRNCTALTKVDFRNAIKTIPQGAFAGCTALTGMEIPETVTSIERDAFKGCTALSEMNIPQGVTAIGESVFQKCTALTRVQLPEGLTDIGPRAFQGCGKLVEVNLSDSIRTIGESAFGECKALTAVAIPKDLTEFGGFAFADCTGLKSVTIPEGVTAIGYGGFSGCTTLNEVRFCGDAPAFGHQCFDKVTAKVYYPEDNPTWTEKVMKDYSGDLTWIPYTQMVFHDVSADAFYYDAVLWAIENGITEGTASDAFSPGGICNRAQVVTFLWRAAGSPEPSVGENPFADVQEGAFYEKAVLWAVEKGITNGISDTSFGPELPCNRATVVTFLHRAFDEPAIDHNENPFTDVSDGNWYIVPVLWAVENGITKGLSDSEFGPETVCNRAQVVTFLYRAYCA